MDSVKIEMIAEAIEQYPTIRPCGGKKAFHECFTYDDGYLVLWFDTPDRSTHVLWRYLEQM